ncbi:MAG: DUF1801 domain-containing protein [Bacteroidota bacterium]
MDTEKKIWIKDHLWPEGLEVLKSIIAKTELAETTKWGGPVYTINGKNVLAIAGFKNFFTLWFHKGVFLKDEGKILVNANEGTTKYLRQWRFTSKDEIDEALVLKYILEAIAVEKAGMGIALPKKELAIPEYLQALLNADTVLKTAFEAFSPYKQKEFAQYITEAKKDKTKLARFEKIKPIILEGKGLNDKYR